MKKVKVFFLPFAGGSKYSYAAFKKEAPSFLEIIPIEMPGHGGRFTEPLLNRMDEMVEDAFGQIKDKLEGPFMFFGHSMGAKMAYLLIHKLIEKGLPTPFHFFASGSAGPQTKRDDEKPHLLPRQDFISKLKAYDGSPKEVLENEMMMDLFEPILRADFEAAYSYNYSAKSPLKVPITVFIGTEEKVTAAEARAWQQETKAPFSFHALPGKHFFIFQHTMPILNKIEKVASEFLKSHSE